MRGTLEYDICHALLDCAPQVCDLLMVFEHVFSGVFERKIVAKIESNSAHIFV
jgi:hypothetical protein